MSLLAQFNIKVCFEALSISAWNQISWLWRWFKKALVWVYNGAVQTQGEAVAWSIEEVSMTSGQLRSNLIWSTCRFWEKQFSVSRLRKSQGNWLQSEWVFTGLSIWISSSIVGSSEQKSKHQLILLDDTIGQTRWSWSESVLAGQS